MLGTRACTANRISSALRMAGRLLSAGLPFGDSLHPTKRLRHLAQHDQQLGLVTIGQDAIDDLQRQRRFTAVQLGHRLVMGSASHHPISVVSPAYSPPPDVQILRSLVAAVQQQRHHATTDTA